MKLKPGFAYCNMHNMPRNTHKSELLKRKLAWSSWYYPESFLHCSKNATMTRRQHKGTDCIWKNRSNQSLRCDLWMHVCSFLQSTDRTTRWRSVRAADRTATTASTWSGSSAPSKVSKIFVFTGRPRCISVWVWSVNRCAPVCADMNPRSPTGPLSLHGSFSAWCHVSVLVAVRLSAGWKYSFFSVLFLWLLSSLCASLYAWSVFGFFGGFFGLCPLSHLLVLNKRGILSDESVWFYVWTKSSSLSLGVCVCVATCG